MIKCPKSTFVSYLLLHNKWLKIINIYYLKVSVSQEFRSSWAEWLWLRVSYEVAIKMLARLWSQKSLTGAKKICFQNGSFFQMLAGTLSSLTLGLLHLAVCLAQQNGSWLLRASPRRESKAVARMSHTITSDIFYWPYRFSYIYESHKDEQGIIENHLEYCWP